MGLFHQQGEPSSLDSLEGDERFAGLDPFVAQQLAREGRSRLLVGPNKHPQPASGSTEVEFFSASVGIHAKRVTEVSKF